MVQTALPESDEASAAPPDAAPADRSPEARRREVLAGGHPGRFARFGPGTRVFEVLRRVVVGTWNDGTIHAGNLAYMALLAIFPFFITAAAIFSAIGEQSERAATIAALVSAFPPTVAGVIEPVARTVIDARSGWLLWVGAIVGLWTTGSLIETIRDILRRAYGTRPTRAFWRYRVGSVGIIVGAVMLLFGSLVVQVASAAAQDSINTYFPEFGHAVADLALSRVVTGAALLGSIWLLFIILTPSKYRARRYHKWPGALLVTLWWLVVAAAFPPILRSLFTYDLTYGSLAGVMITLFFFWLVGLGIVAGAELNAALAETPEEERDRIMLLAADAAGTDTDATEDSSA